MDEKNGLSTMKTSKDSKSDPHTYIIEERRTPRRQSRCSTRSHAQTSIKLVNISTSSYPLNLRSAINQARGSEYETDKVDKKTGLPVLKISKAVYCVLSPARLARIVTALTISSIKYFAMNKDLHLSCVTRFTPPFLRRSSSPWVEAFHLFGQENVVLHFYTRRS